MALDLVATGYWILSSMVIYFSITTRVQVVIKRPPTKQDSQCGAFLLIGHWLRASVECSVFGLCVG